MKIKMLAEQYAPYILDRRHFYHAYPELSGEEKETIKTIEEDLRAIGITDIKRMKKSYGLVADIHGGQAGKTVALRADIDALPVQEESDLPFASKIQGKMHACGHDNHIAMQLGAGRILYDLREELQGTVRLVFQPAEEIAAGAKDMMQEGALEGVSAIYGVHVWGSFDAPYMDFSGGNRMACCHKFVIEVEGCSAHASAPHEGIDAVMVSCSIMEALQQCVSRMNDPLNPLVLTIGKVTAGNRWNVLAGRATLEGTVRTFSAGDQVETMIRKVVKDIAAAFGATVSMSYDYLAEPVINSDDRLNRIAQDAVIRLYGKESLRSLPAMMGSEDFSIFGKSGIPYIYGFLGIRNPEKNCIYSNHHEKFNVDEDVLPRGSAVAAQFAMDYLAETASK